MAAEALVKKNLSFKEAVKYAVERDVVLPDEYYGKLVGVQRSQATTIAGLASLEQIKFVIDAVSKVLKDGGTFASFQEAVKKGDMGIKLPKHRLDNIFRTNMQASYARGRWDQQGRVMSTRPYLMYDAINDSRTRAAHSAMDNTILHRDDPFWKTHYPPNGYRCRCTVISLSEKQAQKRGITVLPPVADPDDGWDYNPGAEYVQGAKDALTVFDIPDKPRLAAAMKAKKKDIREASDRAGSNRDGAPEREADQ